MDVCISSPFYSLKCSRSGSTIAIAYANGATSGNNEEVAGSLGGSSFLELARASE